MTGAADELEAMRQFKARYCRFCDTNDAESRGGVSATDVVFTRDRAASAGVADPMAAPGGTGPQGPGNFVPMVMVGLENLATKATKATKHPPIQESHTPEITLTSARAISGRISGRISGITGIWAMEDAPVFGFVFGDARELHGAGHYPETYEKRDGGGRIESLHLPRTLPEISGGGDG